MEEEKRGSQQGEVRQKEKWRSAREAEGTWERVNRGRMGGGRLSLGLLLIPLVFGGTSSAPQLSQTSPLLVKGGEALPVSSSVFRQEKNTSYCSFTPVTF